jgi:NAD(P)-dependent dehydrogenase (short-subunit alcohol dehydrogenase family)
MPPETSVRWPLTQRLSSEMQRGDYRAAAVADAAEPCHLRHGPVHFRVVVDNGRQPGRGLGQRLPDRRPGQRARACSENDGILALGAAGGGSIVNISSLGGMTGFPGVFAYQATKWASRGMTKAAAQDLARLGIRVNSIHPGVIDTPAFEAEIRMRPDMRTLPA